MLARVQKGEKHHPDQQTYYAPKANTFTTTLETSVVDVTSANGAPSVVVSTQNSLIFGEVFDPSHWGT